MPESTNQKTSTIDEFSYKKRPTRSLKISKDQLSLIDSAKQRLNFLISSNLFDDAQKIEIEKQIEKIDSLKLLIIPTENGKKRYYSITDSAGGVTEKTCLIDEETLNKNLLGLKNSQTFDDLMNNKIRMNAILKHPKAGKDTEVQREAIGLKIARILNFSHVTESTMVNHDIGNGKHPCLFVPFGKMELLTESMEKTNTSKGRIKKENFKSIEDFGKYSAFFMLCSDPDFIGKSGQNKGLTGDGIKRLYIFDQVFMTSKNLFFDRSFNLVPTNILSKTPNFVARHFMGRNKSVINDSSFEEKIQGTFELLQKKDAIKEMFRDVIKASLNPTNNIDKSMQKDARTCLKSFNNRISGIEKLFPPIKVNGVHLKVGDLVKTGQLDHLQSLKKSMLTTQLINKPQLFDKSGKPYRAPFFTNPTTYLKKVSIEGDMVTVSFSRKFGPALSETKKALLQEHGFKISQDGKSASISSDQLSKINENNYFKEELNELDLNHHYLNKKIIDNLAKTYGENEQNINHLKSNLNDNGLLNHNLDSMTFKNKGFKAHIEQCLLYEKIKHIILIAPEDKKEQLLADFKIAKQNGSLKTFFSGLETQFFRGALNIIKKDIHSSEKTPESLQSEENNKPKFSR